MRIPLTNLLSLIDKHFPYFSGKITEVCIEIINTSGVVIPETNEDIMEIHKRRIRGNRKDTYNEFLTDLLEWVNGYEQNLEGEHRQKDGAFYTPYPIASAMVKHAIITRLSNSIRESDINLALLSLIKTIIQKMDIMNPYNFNIIDTVQDFGKTYSQEISKQHIEHILSKLESFTFLDPSCGAGIFLISIMNTVIPLMIILEQLLIEKRGPKQLYSINDSRNKIRPSPMLLRSMLQNIFAIEKNGESRAVSVISVFLNGLKISENFGIISDEKERSENYEQLSGLIKSINERIKTYDSLALLLSPNEVIHNFRKLHELKGDISLNRMDVPDSFDIIIGNPPHKRYFKSPYRDRLKREYPELSNNIASYFIILSLKLIKHRGTCSFIFPKQFAYNEGWKKLRTIIYGKVQRLFIIDIENLFDMQNNEQIILELASIDSNLHKRISKLPMIITARFNEWITEYKGTGINGEILKSIDHIPVAVNNTDLNLFERIMKNTRGRKLCMIGLEGFRGLPAKYTFRLKNSGEETLSKEKDLAPVFEKRDLDKYILKTTNCFLSDQGEISLKKMPKARRLMGEKIIAQRIITFTKVPRNLLQIKAFWDPAGVMTKSTLVNIFLKEDKTSTAIRSGEFKGTSGIFSVPLLTILLNSRFYSFYARRFIYCKYFETSKDLDLKYILKFPLPPLKEESADLLEIISIYLHIIRVQMEFQENNVDNNIEKQNELRNRLKSMFKSLERIGNQMIYILYLLSPIESAHTFKQIYNTPFIRKIVKEKPVLKNVYAKLFEIYLKRILSSSKSSIKTMGINEIQKTTAPHKLFTEIMEFSRIIQSDKGFYECVSQIKKILSPFDPEEIGL